MRRYVHLLPGALSLSLVIAAVACTGDDPAAPALTPEVDGGTSSSSSSSSSSSGTSSGACAAGFDDCNGNASDGCESRVAADAKNCGKCGNVCGAVHTLASACTAGACALTCEEGYARCGTDAEGCNTKVVDDPLNCGACGRACGPNSTCKDKQCSVVTLFKAGSDPTGMPNDYPQALAVDATGVWYISASNRLWRMFKDGANLFNPFSQKLSGARALVTDGSKLVWANYDDDTTDTLVTASYVGTSVQNALEAADNVEVTYHGFLALSGNTVFWSNSSASDDSVRRVDFDGKNPGFVTEGPGSSAGLAVDKSDVYWADGKHIYRQPLAATTPCKVGTGATCALVATSASYAVALDDKNVYFTDGLSLGGTVKKVAKTGGAVTTLATNQAGPISLATDGKHVYWGNWEPGPAKDSVRRATVDAAAPCDGDACEAVSTASVDNPTAIVLDDKFVYWIDQASVGGVFKRAK